jgi:hypothetical protein
VAAEGCQWLEVQVTYRYRVKDEASLSGLVCDYVLPHLG